MTVKKTRGISLGLSRRRFLSTAAATGFGAIAMPYLSRAADRPQITHGVQSGDVGADGGVVWARADRPSQMMVEVATTESFGNARVLPPIAALPESDFTAKMLLENLPSGQDIFYRVKLRDGKIWKNVTVPEKAKVAETLDEFRAAHKYNFLDDNLRAFNAEVPIFVQWDDHEVTNNWSASKQLPAAYKERDITLLAARAARAFHEMYPMRESLVEPGRVYRTLNYGPHLDVFMLDERSYRGPNGPNLQTAYGPDSYFLGPDQLAWLKRALLSSRATWKVIASDMPLSIIVYDDAPNKKGSEAFAQGDGRS